jgi:putative ABC transport system permease protein
MRPDLRELDDEIRGHLAIEIQERIDRGETPDAARRGALAEFGYIPDVRDSIRRVWYSRWFDTASALVQDMRIGLRSLRRAPGLAAAVVITLALGIGANAAIFSVVRGVLLRPLVNRDEDRLIYIRQSAPGIGADNTTFSVPEIDDLKSRLVSIAAFGDFSTIDFRMIGLGEARQVRAGVVSGSYFEVMGLRPVLGRLLNAGDDGTRAAGAAVLTHRFWTGPLNSDPAVIGTIIRLGPRSATVVGVLEPSLPYPADTEIIANVVTSPHHLGATMVTGRTHRMTELFGRLAPGATLEGLRAELDVAYRAMLREHPEAYSARADMRVRVTPLRDQITAPARTTLLLLLAAAGIVFVIACSNVANLILARSVRREGELAVRAALGASHGALRRTLLAESLVLCGAGAVLGVALAQPLVGVVARFASRLSVRALEVPVDASLLWVAAALAMGAAVLLAYVPRLPASLDDRPGRSRQGRSAQAPAGLGLANGSVRLTPSLKRRLQVFATTQIAFSFVLLGAAGTLLGALVTLQSAETGYHTREVLALDLPTSSIGISDDTEMAFYQELTRRVRDLPGVRGVAIGNFIPWRDRGRMPELTFTAEGYTPANGEEQPHARLRIVAPAFFAVLGVPLVGGRDFTDDDRARSEPVVVISESIARRLFPNGEALNRKLWWTDPALGKPLPRRIVGVVADVDDESLVPGPVMTIYHPVQQMRAAGRLFVHAAGDPYALVPEVTRVIRGMSANQPVERAATLEDVRVQVMAPERLNAYVLTGFAGVALLIAAVGVAGVLAFGVSARTREFGVRLAVGSTRGRLMAKVLAEGTSIVAIGIGAGAVGAYVFATIAARYVDDITLPGVLPLAAAAAVLGAAAMTASMLPAARASRVDVLQALKAD